MSWEKVMLGSVAETCLGKMLDRNKNRGSYQPYLANINVRWGSFDLENLQEMRFEADENERYGLNYGDLVICEGGVPGRCALWRNQIPNMKIQKALHRVRVNDEMDSRYVYYWFLLAGRRGALQQYYTGATIMHMTGQKLRTVIIDKPPLDIQNKISDYLESFDNLIENNQKQIKLLEEAAQRLYKEWFIDLRFPGHENVEIVDGVPEGWNIRTLGELNHRLESGSRPKGGIDSNLKDGIPSIGAENVIGLGKYNFSSEKLISKEFYENMNKGKLKDRDILIYKDGAYIGRTSLFQDDFPHRKASVNEHVFLLHMDDEALQYYVFFTLYRPEYYLKMQNLNKNSAQPGINMKVLKTLDILVPNQSIVTEFNDLVSPIIKSIFSKSKQIKMLTEARDRLLPKLMSGEIEV